MRGVAVTAALVAAMAAVGAVQVAAARQPTVVAPATAYAAQSLVGATLTGVEIRRPDLRFPFPPRFVSRLTGARILDTRKTTPGWRRLQKYAVRCGGGVNHRFDLSSAVLIKDNHLAATDGDVAVAIRRAREHAGKPVQVEVECETAAQVQAAVGERAEIVLLDNMSLDDLRACVAIAKGKAVIEASGGVRLDTVRAIAETGVDHISVGALTHSAPALNLALDFE